MSLRLIFFVILITLQSCSNTRLGEKLESSFDVTDSSSTLGDTTEVKAKKKSSEIKTIKLSKNDDDKVNKKASDRANLIEDNVMSNKNRFIQKPTKSIKKAIFNPQPYRIILKLSGANPSAPAETVTEALRKAGVQFEVEKIERYNEENLLNDASLKR